MNRHREFGDERHTGGITGLTAHGAALGWMHAVLHKRFLLLFKVGMPRLRSHPEIRRVTKNWRRDPRSEVQIGL